VIGSLSFPAVPLDSAPTRAGRAALLLGATAVTLLLGVVVGSSARPAVTAVLLAGGLAGLVVAIAVPRAVLVVTLFALIGYFTDVLAGGALAMVASAAPVLLAAALLVRTLTGAEAPAVPAEWRRFAVYGFALALTVIAARDPGSAMGELTDFVGFALLALVVLVLVDSPAMLRRAMWAVVGALAVLAVLTIFQQLTKRYGDTFGGLATVTPDRDGLRSNGPISANYFAEVLAAASPLAWYLAASARARAERVAAIVSSALLLWAVVYTLSRGAFVAIVVVGVIAALLRGVRLARLGLVAAGAVAVAIVLLPATVTDRVGDLGALTEGTRTTDTSLRGRLGENLAALEMFADHPVLGVGPDNFELQYAAYAQRIGLDPRPEVRGAHSLYLESLAETGLLGTLPFLALLGLGVRSSWRRRGQLTGAPALLVEGCCLGLVAFLVCALTLHLTYPRYLWIFVALAFAAGRVTATSDETREPVS
jgi:hypothetical protein